VLEGSICILIKKKDLSYNPANYFKTINSIGTNQHPDVNQVLPII